MNYTELKRRALRLLASIAVTAVLITSSGRKPDTKWFPYSVIEVDLQKNPNALEEVEDTTYKDIQITLPKQLDEETTYDIVNSIKMAIAKNKIGNIYIDVFNAPAVLNEIKWEYINQVRTLINNLVENKIKFTIIADDFILEKLRDPENKDYNTMGICLDDGDINNKLRENELVFSDNMVITSARNDYTAPINNKLGFKDNIHIVRPKETLSGIANHYGIDYMDIATYNEIENPSLIQVGQTIRIPWSIINDSLRAQNEENEKDAEYTNIDEDMSSEFTEDVATSDNLDVGNEKDAEPDYESEDEYNDHEKPIENEDYESDNEDESDWKTNYDPVDPTTMAKGIDISEFNGDIDFNKLQESNVDFIIMRVGFGIDDDGEEVSIKDERFDEYRKLADEYNIAYGGYYLASATNEKKAKKEAENILKLLTDENDNLIQFALPFYFDIEGLYKDLLYESEESRQTIINALEVECRILEEAGYTVGIYINYKDLALVEELIEHRQAWAAVGYLYDTPQDFEDVRQGYITEDEKAELTDQNTIFQTTSKVDAEPLGIQSQYVDVDYMDRELLKELIDVFTQRKQGISLTYRKNGQPKQCMVYWG